MRLRRLCLEILALRRFFSEPMKIIVDFLPSSASIQTSRRIGCNLLLHPEIVRIKQSFFEEDNQNADCSK
jgi:hypothetical protein